MKKLLSILIMIPMLMFTISACGSNNSNKETTEATTTEATKATSAESFSDDSEYVTPLVINSEAYTVKPSDCDSRGYKAFTCDNTGTYTFDSVNKGNEDVTWTVYIMDKKYDDATRYISQTEDPALEGDGELSIKEGQYIYVQCSANSFTVDGDLPDDACLEINIK